MSRSRCLAFQYSHVTKDTNAEKKNVKIYFAAVYTLLAEKAHALIIINMMNNIQLLRFDALNYGVMVI